MFTPFSFRRMMLLAGRGARAFAALAELTPARADMMFAMLREELSQKELVMALGISKSVVSRMVRALEKLLPPKGEKGETAKGEAVKSEATV